MAVLGCLYGVQAAPKALSPRPQEAKYGDGKLAVKDLAIGFAMEPTADDKFAAEQLAAGLSAKTGAAVKVHSGKSSGSGIVLNCTGTGASLPGMNDSAGPDPRESYSIKVTKKGAEVRAPYREAWLEESTPYRLGTAMARWDEENRHWMEVWRRLDNLLHTHKQDGPFPTIEVLRGDNK
jgi:hypothetical protein